VTHAIRLRGLTRLCDGVPVVDGVDLDCYPGEGVALVGGTGGGRSTLLRMMATLVRPSAGEILIDGVDAVADARGARARVLYVHPGAFRGAGLSVREYLHVVAQSPRARRADAARPVTEVLRQAALDADADVDRLDRGARCRLAMAASLMLAPAVVLLDDVVDRLEPESCRCVSECVMSLRQAGTAVISSVSTTADAAVVADVAMVMTSGRLSSPSILRSSSGLMRTRTGQGPQIAGAV
jgi:ABC-type multidrug transport system ATPase subunit